MQKTIRRSACLLFVLTLAAAIVIPTVADPVSEIVGGASSGVTAEDVPTADDFEQSVSIEANEPSANDLVKVIVEVDTPSLLEYANKKGITVQDAMLTSEGVRVMKKIESMSESAEKALAPYIVERGFSYNAVLSGFSATVRYKDVSRLEEDVRVADVVLADTYEVPQAVTENQVRVDGSTGIYDSSMVDYDGTGTVVAVLDTGTDYTHEVFDMELDDTLTAITKDDVAAVASTLAATSMSAANDESIDEDDLYLTTKLPYAYDYADGDANVYPAEAHGTHVAGIIAGKSERITGVATGAQIATFKVFPDTGEGAGDDGIIAALNDAVILGVDAINMSLGSSCGFTREADDDPKNAIYDRVEEAGICLVVAASNDYSSAYGSANGNTNLASNPDSGTVGSPASYEASLAVASISGVKTPYFLTSDGREIYFRESRITGKTDENDFVAGMLGSEQEGTFDFVVIPGVGYEANYTGIDIEGKVAVVRRGGNSFEQKVKIAANMGAKGVIIYNNVSGMLNMSVGTKEVIPSCLISMDYGDILVELGQGTITLSKDYLAGPFMSDFSSWGVLPNLTLSPDITAHGGEITSSYPGGNEYDTISGTSMACPNLAGALILVRQYVKDLDPTLTAPEIRDLSYSLMMSTATIANNEYGNPYSPRKQGAGLADIEKSVSTKAYLTVDGSNKPKLSLGDDPNRTGVYTLEFNVTNMDGAALSYNIDPVVFTETMSSDGRTVAELAYLLDATYTYTATATEGSASMSGSNLSLGGYSSARITVTLTLSDAAKDYLDANFVNGMYVEGYVRLNSLNADGIGLNLPYLAFYGDWTDAPMLDVSAYEVGASQVDSSVLEEDKLVADVYATLPMAGFDSQDANGNPTVGYWGMGAYAYILPQGETAPVTQEKYASLTSSQEGAYMLYSISAGLLRGAKRIEMQITDSVTGEVIWERTSYNGRKSSSSGGEQGGGYVLVEFDVREMELANNSVYTFSMECFLDYGEGEEYGTLGNTNTFSFDFTMDDEKPVFLDTYVRAEGNRKEIEFNIYDNHYLQGYIVYTYESLDENGNPVGLTPVTDSVVPVRDGEFNSSTRVTLDVTSKWSQIVANGGKLYVQAMDYARNSTTEFITLEKSEISRIEMTRSSYANQSISQNAQVDLSEYVRAYVDVEGEELEGYWAQDLVWESADESIAVVGNGEVEGGLVVGLKQGNTTVTVHPQGNAENTLTFNIEVTDRKASVNVTGLELSEYALELERGEEATIEITHILPFTLPEELTDGLEFTWKSSSATVRVTASEDGRSATVKALESGSATVTVQVKGLIISASCSVSVKEEFYVDGLYLRSYTGRGDENGVVEIPDDLGITYIYPNAFFDNDYITEIIIPEGVMYIMRAGIYGCENLEKVTLPSTLEQIQTFGMAWNPNLKTVVGLNHVTVVGSRAFIYDTSLELGYNGTDEEGNPNGEYDLAGTTFIQNMAFYGCDAITDLDLSKVGVVSDAAFAYCNGLVDVVIPANTTLEASVFQSCTALERVTIYSQNIGDAAFAMCTSLESVVFAGDVKFIGVQAFYGNTMLRDVRFLKTVYSIGSLAFADCPSLTEFTLPAGLEVLGSQPLLGTSVETVKVSKDARITTTELAAFAADTVKAYEVEEGNKYFSSKDGVLFDKTGHTLVAFPAGVQTTDIYTVPEGVTAIGDNAFAGVTGVYAVDLNEVETIGDYAFFAFGGLISDGSGRVSIFGQVAGDNVRTIGDYAFSQSYVMALPVSKNTVSIGEEAFSYTPLLGYGTDGAVVIPDSVTYLGQNAFYRNGYIQLNEVYYPIGMYLQNVTGITSVTLGDGLKTVGTGAFAYCADLARVDFGSLTSLAASMFEGCTALERVAIPDGVEMIGEYAFAGCTALTSVTLPEGLDAIADGVFMNTALEEIALPASVATVGDFAFEGTSLTSFDFTNITSVGARAFANTLLTAAKGEKVTFVGDEAFAFLAEEETAKASATLTSVSFPAAKSIGAYAFAGNGLLLDADVSAAESIGEGAFDGCSRLASLSAAAVQSLGSYALRGTSALTEVTLPALTELGAEAFSGSAVTSLALPATLRSVAERALAGAEQLAGVTVAEGSTLYTAKDGVLYRNTGSYGYLTLVAYPEGKQDETFDLSDGGKNTLRVIRIGAYAFADNAYLKEIVLPVYLRVIGAAAFYGCTSLNKITFLSATAPTLESYSYAQADGTTENVYNNFKNAIGEEHGITIELPSNFTGYDVYLWEQYFGEIAVENGEVVGNESVTLSGTAQPIRNAINFMDRVSALPSPENITEADRDEITLLQRIYNTLVTEQKAFVTGKFDGTDYSAILTAAAAALPDLPDDNTPGGDIDGNQDGNEPQGANLGLIIGLSVGGAVVVAGIAVAVVFIVRKQRRN